VTAVETRETALQALYEAEIRRVLPEPPAPESRASRLAQGVWREREELDAVIGSAAEHWTVERMTPVDRIILRIALYELRHRPDVPVAVIISEAVQLAKEYSTERSGAFVNGVLARLAEMERPPG
jgi:N utilization substance protein B